MLLRRVNHNLSELVGTSFDDSPAANPWTYSGMADATVHRTTTGQRTAPYWVTTGIGQADLLHVNRRPGLTIIARNAATLTASVRTPVLRCALQNK